MTIQEQLQTHEQRVGFVAYHYVVGYDQSAWLAAQGVSDEEIDEGSELGRKLAAERRSNYAAHGDPAYGSWNYGTVSQPILDQVLRMMDAPIEVKA